MDEINAALREGVSSATVAARYGVSLQAVQRHDRNHRRAGQLALIRAAALAVTGDAPEAPPAPGSALGTLLHLRNTVQAVQAAAAQRSDPRLVLDATRVQLMISKELAEYGDDNPETIHASMDMLGPLLETLSAVAYNFPAVGRAAADVLKRTLTKTPLGAQVESWINETAEMLISNANERENEK